MNLKIVLLLCIASALAIASFSQAAAKQSPIATATPVEATHIVRSGETLSLIAATYGVTVDQIVDANNLLNRNIIHINQRLIIPSPAISTRATPTPSPISVNAENDVPVSRLACPSNTMTFDLDLPAVPIRLLVLGERIYLIADGDLFAVPMPKTTSRNALTPSNLMPAERRIGEVYIQELVYMAVDGENGDLLLLDKTNDVYRYSVDDGMWQTASLASQVPGQFPDPQFLAIQAVNGHIYALDSDLEHIWLLTEDVPQEYLSRRGLGDGVDMAIISSNVQRPQFAVLGRDGAVTRFQAAASTIELGDLSTVGTPWPSQILAGEGYLYIADGEERKIEQFGIDGASLIQELQFRLPEMGRLRGFDIVDETLYAIAGLQLLVVDLDGGETAICSRVPFADHEEFYGIDLAEVAADLQLPFDGVTLPVRPRSYPGARRLYRHGIHSGLDIYGLDAPGLHIGSPVLAVADGLVTRLDDEYVEKTPAEFETAVKRTVEEHRTPPDLIDQFYGRQVRIDHGNGAKSVYSHLSSTDAALTLNGAVEQSQTVGQVGVSGTSAGTYNTGSGAHLHLELWFNDRYLGQGRSLYETIRLWQALFEGSLSPSLTATATPLPLAVTPTVTAMPTATATPDTPHACQQPPDDYTLTTINGEIIDARTLWMLQLADSLYEGRGDPLRVVQGSYTNDVDASFGTHAGGGAVDISIRVKANPELVMGIDEAGELVMALRQAGFAAWLRQPYDLDPPTALHIHAIAVGDQHLSEAAQAQIAGQYGYFAGLDGVPPEYGGPKLDRYGGPYLCDWMDDDRS